MDFETERLSLIVQALDDEPSEPSSAAPSEVVLDETDSEVTVETA